MRERQSTKVITRPRTIHLVQLTDSEVQDLANIGNVKAVSVALASFFFGVFSNLVLAAIMMPLGNPYLFAGLVIGAIFCFAIGTLFSISAAKSFFHTNQRLRDYLNRESQSRGPKSGGAA